MLNSCGWSIKMLTYASSPLDGHNLLQQLLNSYAWSIKMLTYASNLLDVHNMLQQNEDIYKIKSTDSLSEQTAVTLQKAAHCIGIKNSHKVNQKMKPIQMIVKRHANLTGKPDTGKMMSQPKIKNSR